MGGANRNHCRRVARKGKSVATYKKPQEEKVEWTKDQHQQNTIQLHNNSIQDMRKHY